MPKPIAAGLCVLLFVTLLAGCKRKQTTESWLSHRGRVLALSNKPKPEVIETQWVELAQVPDLRDVLAGEDPDALRDALRFNNIDALWVSLSTEKKRDNDNSLMSRLARRQWVANLVGVEVRAEETLVTLDHTTLIPPPAAKKLARAARLILQGKTPPPLSAFPAVLNANQQTEVAVFLRQKGQLRLWRSARARSVAKALSSAAVAARDRWFERETMMGGPLSSQLASLDIEVWQFVDDGTLVIQDDRALGDMASEMHGFGYEQPGRWRYVLPEQAADYGSPALALRSLFKDNGLGEQSYDRKDLRLYRFVTRRLSVDFGERQRDTP